MKSKLNKRRGFTIAEIIMAVAIMAILIGTVMKSLQSSRESVKADMVRAEMVKRLSLAKAKIEAALANEKTPQGDLKDILGSDDLTDANGETYTFAYASQNGTYSITVTPGNKALNAGVKAQTTKWH